MSKKSEKEYPKDPRNLDEILWILQLKEHDIFDQVEEGKPKRSDWLKQWFKDLKSKLLEPNFSYEQTKESPQETEKTTGIKAKKRNDY
jgi:hypothetical protein